MHDARNVSMRAAHHSRSCSVLCPDWMRNQVLDMSVTHIVALSLGVVAAPAALKLLAADGPSPRDAVIGIGTVHFRHLYEHGIHCLSGSAREQGREVSKDALASPPHILRAAREHFIPRLV
eukprot:2952839-Amphidinium_carterae.1